jgi:hypothetical protein
VRDYPCTIVDLGELQVVVGVDRVIPGCAVPNLKVEHRLFGSIRKLVAYRGTRLETTAISCAKQIFLVIKHQSWGSGHNVNEFVLLRVVMNRKRTGNTPSVCGGWLMPSFRCCSAFSPWGPGRRRIRRPPVRIAPSS